MNRNYEKFLYANGCNGNLWADGTLYAICDALGMGGGNGLGTSFSEEINLTAPSFYRWVKSKTYYGFYDAQTGVTIYPDIAADGGLEKFARDNFGEFLTGLGEIEFAPQIFLSDLGVCIYRGNGVSDIYITSTAQSQPDALYIIVGHEVKHLMCNSSGLFEYYKNKVPNFNFEMYTEKIAYDWSDNKVKNLDPTVKDLFNFGTFKDWEQTHINGNHAIFDPIILSVFKHFSKGF